MNIREQHDSNEHKLTLIRLLHTAIWGFFNVVIFYMLYAAIIGQVDAWVWTGYALILTEGIVLAAFRLSCPLTILARRYSDSTRDNFDIYLPEWLARYTKVIYTSLVGVIILITIIQWVSR